MAAAVPLSVVIRGKDFSSKTFKTVTASARRMGIAMAGTVKRIGRQFSLLRKLIVGAMGVAVVKTFAEFEKGIASIATLTDDAAGSFGAFSDAAQKAMLLTGSSVQDTTTALFDLVSAQVATADSTEVLTQAGKLAIAGSATLSDATSGLIAIIKSYSLSASDAERVSDALFQAQKLGITTVGELSVGIGKLSPIARQAGIGFEEMLASVSALTAVTGLSTPEAITALRAALQSAIKPSEQSAEAARKLGIQWDAAKLKSEGLIGLLKQLSKDGIKPTVEQMAALAGSVTGFVGLAALAGDEAKVFQQTIEGMGKAASVTETNFKFMSKTLAVQMQRLRASFATVAVELGTGLKPVIEEVIEGLNDLATWIKRNDNVIVGFVTRTIRVLMLVGEFLATKLKQLFHFFKTSIEEGTFIKDILTVVRNLLVALAKLFVASIPILTQAATTLGRAVGLALVQAVIGSSKATMAQRVAGGDGFLEWLLGKFLSDAEIGKLKEVGKELTQIEQTMAAVGRPVRQTEERKKLAAEITALEARLEKLRAAPRRLGSAMDTVRKEQVAEVTKQLEELQRVFEFQDVRFQPLSAFDVPALKERQEALVKELGGMGSDLLFQDTEEFKRRVKVFKGEATTILTAMVDDILVQMSPKVSAAAAPLFQGWVELINGIKGIVSGMGREATKDFWENFVGDVKAAQPELIATAQATFGGMTSAADGFVNTLKNAKTGITGLFTAFGAGAPTPAAAPAAPAPELNLGSWILDTPEEQLTFAQQTGQNIAEAMNLIDTDDGVKRLKNIGEVYAEAFTDGVLSIINAFQSTLSDTFYSLFTGDFEGIKEAFNNFFQSILRAMADFVAQMIAQWLVLKALGILGSLFSAGTSSIATGPEINTLGEVVHGTSTQGGYGLTSGGFISMHGERGAVWPGGFQAFQNGGMVNRATLGLVGEGRNAEAIVPLPDNRSIPVSFTGGGGAQNVVVNVNFDVTAMDSRDVSQMIVAESATIAGVVQRSLNQNVNFKQGVAARVGKR